MTDILKKKLEYVEGLVEAYKDANRVLNERYIKLRLLVGTLPGVYSDDEHFEATENAIKALKQENEELKAELAGWKASHNYENVSTEDGEYTLTTYNNELPSWVSWGC